MTKCIFFIGVIVCCFLVSIGFWNNYLFPKVVQYLAIAQLSQDEATVMQARSLNNFIRFVPALICLLHLAAVTPFVLLLRKGCMK